MKKINLAVLLIIVFAIFNSCKNENDDPKPDENVVKPKVIVIDTEVVDKKLDTIVNGTLTFSGLSSTETPKTGEIICSAPAEGAPYGFFYKVKTVSSSNNKTVITTERAYLDEAIENADVSKTVNLTNNVKKVIGYNGQSIPFQKVKQGDISTGIKIDIDHEVKFKNNISAKLKGSLELAADANFEIKFGFFKLEKLKTTISPKVKIKVTLGVEGKIEDSGIVHISSVYLAPVTIMAGTVPIVFNPVISIDAKVTAEGKIKVEATLLSIENEYTYGMLYENGEFSKIKEEDLKPIKDGADLALTLSGELKAEPQVSVNFRLYDQEAYLGIFSGFYATLATDDIKFDLETAYGLKQFNPKLKLTTGISLGPDAKLEFFSKKIAEWKPTFDVISWDIWQRDIFPVFSSISTDVVDGNSVTASCEITEFPSLAIPVTQYGFVWGASPFPTIEDGKLTDFGTLETVTETSPKALSYTIKNLQPNTNYTVRPFFNNWLGTFYGEAKTFTTNVGSLILSPEVLVFAVSDAQKSVQISGGSGVYKISNSNSSVASATLLANIVNVKPLKEGTTTITISDNVNSSLKKDLQVTVKASIVNNITLSQNTMSLRVNETNQLSVTAGNGVYSVVSSNNSIATATVSGNIIYILGVAKGSATVTVKDELINLFSTVTVTVTDGNTPPIVTTTAFNNITTTTATGGGNITSDGGSAVTARGVCWNTTGNPTIADSKTTDGTGTGTFTSSMTALSAGTTYYARAYATNSIGTSYGDAVSFTTVSDNTIPPPVFNPNVTYGTMTDIDGNVYKTVTIGTQTWMAENLKVTRYNDGTVIPNVTDNTAWQGLSTGAYCWYNNDISYKATYGALYNWYAVNTGKLAPAGWHVATDAEWTTLTNYLGGESVAGGKLKETGTTHWASPNTGATNETGFSALPGGNRGSNGYSSGIGHSGFWWGSAELGTGSAWYRLMYNDSSSVYRNSINGIGFYVRCVRD